MASYDELRGLFSNSVVKNRVQVALIIAAEGLLTDSPTAAQTAWAAAVLGSPAAEGEKAFRFVLAANSTLTVTQITEATDVQIQNAVDNVVPSLVTAYSAGAGV